MKTNTSYEETFASIKKTMERLKEDMYPEEKEKIENIIKHLPASGSLGRMQQLSDITNMLIKIGMRVNKNRLNRLSGGKY